MPGDVLDGMYVGRKGKDLTYHGKSFCFPDEQVRRDVFLFNNDAHSCMGPTIIDLNNSLRDRGILHHPEYSDYVEHISEIERRREARREERFVGLIADIIAYSL